MVMGFLGKLRDKLGKTRGKLVDNVKRVFSGRSRIDDEIFDDLEEILIEADIGVETTLGIVADMRRIAKEQRLEDPQALYEVLKQEIITLLSEGDHTLDLSREDGPHVTLVA